MTHDPGAAQPRPSLTPPDFPSPLAQPHVNAQPAVPQAPSSPAALPVQPRAGRTAPIWGIAVLVLLLIVLVGYFLNAMGAGASILGMFLALVPLAAVMMAVRIVDRWEPEPRGLLAFAIAWGAIAGVAIALGVDLLITSTVGPDRTPAQELFTLVVRAPVVEEFAKGLGVFIIFAVARRAFDGPIDGIVYGGLVGAGFAFTENIQYFATSYIEGGVVEVSTTFFVRGIMSPFAHVMFTSVTGFALGLAARRGLRPGRAIGPWIIGMIGAMALHAFWNGSAAFHNFFWIYMVAQVPLFVLFVLGIIALRREEARLTRRRLGDYAAAGWFTPQEVDMLATGRGRRAALAWAKSLRGDRTPIMRRFILDATALAATRQRAITGRDARAAEDEGVLLTRTADSRAALFAP